MCHIFLFYYKFLKFNQLCVDIQSYALQSISIRDFDDHATRIVGKYEVRIT